MQRISLILASILLIISLPLVSFAQTKKTQSQKGATGAAAPKKSTVKPTTTKQTPPQTNLEDDSSVGTTYQTLAGGFAGAWSPWTTHHGYRGVQMRARLMQSMQPKGQPWYNWEIEIKNNYQDTITASPFTGDKEKFKNPLISESYFDGAVVTVAPGKINSSSGYRGTKTDVKIYLYLQFANSPKFNFSDGTTGNKVAFHDNGSIPEYCLAYNVPFCPNYKEEEKKVEEVAEKEEKPKQNQIKKDIEKEEPTVDELKQRFANHLNGYLENTGRSYISHSVSIEQGKLKIHIRGDNAYEAYHVYDFATLYMMPGPECNIVCVRVGINHDDYVYLTVRNGDETFLQMNLPESRKLLEQIKVSEKAQK